MAKFDSDNFQERQDAADELQKIGEPAAVVLARADRSKFSPEQSSGADTFLASYLALSAADVARLHDNPDFLLDCLYSDDEQLRRLAVARLESLAGHKLGLDPAAPSDVRTAAVERAREQLAAPVTQPTTRPE